MCLGSILAELSQAEQKPVCRSRSQPFCRRRGTMKGNPLLGLLGAVLGGLVLVAIGKWHTRFRSQWPSKPTFLTDLYH